MDDISFTLQCVRQHFADVQKALQFVDPQMVTQVANIFETARLAGGIVYLCGNGGSAATVSHAACDLMLFPSPSKPHLRAASLSENIPLMSAISNDFDFDDTFCRQFQDSLSEADVVVGVSVSGKSENVLRALEEGRSSGSVTVGLTGEGTSRMLSNCDVCISVPNSTIQAVEDVHMSIFHAVSLALRLNCKSSVAP